MDMRKHMRPFTAAIEIATLKDCADEVMAYGIRILKECNDAHRKARALERAATKVAPGKARRRKNANGLR